MVSGFSGVKVGNEGEHGVDLGHFEKIHDAIVRTGDYELSAVGLATDVVIHDKTHAGGIHVGYGAEVDDGERRQCGAAELGLQFEEIAQGQWTAQSEYSGSGVLAVGADNRKGTIVQHSESSVWNGERWMITVP